jgi:shikimate O-hydroxycinnamoyltransferase
MHVVWLSNLDLLVARSHTPTIYVYRRPSPDIIPGFFSPDVLKAALSKALVPFYPLAGRLAQDGAGRPEIHCTGDGALLVTARADATLQDLAGGGGFAPSDELRQMLVPSAADGEDRAGILAMFQVTRAVII